MNKHRANELLQQASLRAVVVSTQIQKGIDNPILAEFTDNTVAGATFTGLATWNKDTDKRFSLTLTGVSTEICTQMKATVGKNSIIKAIADDCTTITYNNDLSPTDLEPSGPKGDECTDSCSGEAKCENGYCECSPGYIWNPTDNSGNGECTEITEGDCKTNTDCEKGKEYCKITGKYENSCSVPTTGTCETLDGGISKIYNGKTFLYSPSEMSWWSARNWCLAHGMSLVSLSDLGITGGYETDSCSGSECIGADWDSLIEALGYDRYWTNNSKDSCLAFYVTTDYQYVGNDYRANRYTDLDSALCR